MDGVLERLGIVEGLKVGEVLAKGLLLLLSLEELEYSASCQSEGQHNCTTNHSPKEAGCSRE